MDISESVAEVLAQRAAAKTQEKFQASWGVVLTQLQRTEESNLKVHKHLEMLEQKLSTQLTETSKEYQTLTAEIANLKAQQKKAAEILAKATKEMGLTKDE